MADGWQVIDQRDTINFIGSRYQDVVEVTFRTDKGLISTVDIPIAQYGPDAVKAAIDAKVATMHAVQDL